MRATRLDPPADTGGLRRVRCGETLPSESLGVLRVPVRGPSLRRRVHSAVVPSRQFNLVGAVDQNDSQPRLPVHSAPSTNTRDGPSTITPIVRHPEGGSPGNAATSDWSSPPLTTHAHASAPAARAASATASR